MLIACPECSREVSDRAPTCPQCGFPIAQELARQREREALEADRKSREVVGEVDCPHCEARGFTTEENPDAPTTFSWCLYCQHSGRVPLVRSGRGYWAAEYASVDAFVAGEDFDPPKVVALGTDAPQPHRYPNAGPRKEDEP